MISKTERKHHHDRLLQRVKDDRKHYKDLTAAKKTALVHQLINHQIIAVDETGTKKAYSAAVADALTDRGILTYDKATKTYHVNAFMAEQCAMLPSIGVCDFCSAQPITWLAEAETYTKPDQSISVGRWAACDACGHYILRLDRRGLFKRTVAQAMTGLPKQAESFIKTEVAHVHEGFWDHFLGLQPIATS